MALRMMQPGGQGRVETRQKSERRVLDGDDEGFVRIPMNERMRSQSRRQNGLRVLMRLPEDDQIRFFRVVGRGIARVARLEQLILHPQRPVPPVRAPKLDVVLSLCGEDFQRACPPLSYLFRQIRRALNTVQAIRSVSISGL